MIIHFNSKQTKIVLANRCHLPPIKDLFLFTQAFSFALVGCSDTGDKDEC